MAKKTSSKKIKRIQRLHKEGLNNSEISRKLKVSRDTVHKYLEIAKANRVETPPTEEPKDYSIDEQKVEPNSSAGSEVGDAWPQPTDFSGLPDEAEYTQSLFDSEDRKGRLLGRVLLGAVLALSMIGWWVTRD